ncbi:MAG: hypothetical protein IJN79_03815 [Clostridia bacterium]|nr:hypothetical protein [Clostridia bacterium]
MRKWTRTWIMTALFSALLMLPAAADAQDLPQLFAAVKSGVQEGLEEGMDAAAAAMDEELTLSILPESAQIESGKTIRLTVSAGNPRPQAAKVVFSLQLPDRLKAAPDTQWEAVLPPAQPDAVTGELRASTTTFTREITLEPGGSSESAQISAEMSMGTRFYRAKADVRLCVPDIGVTARLDAAPEGRIEPGDCFAYEIEVINSGEAPKDVMLEMTLPEGVALQGEMDGRLRMDGGRMVGQVRAEAAMTDAAGTSPSLQVISLPLRADDGILEGDADARRLIGLALRADGEQVSAPRVEVCGPMISAKLVAQKSELEAGEDTVLSIVVVNAGLAPADMQLVCSLPEGLALKREKEEATPAEAAMLPPQDGDGAAPASAAGTQMLTYDLHIDAAREEGGSITAGTAVIEIPVTALAPQEDLRERLVGAALSWRVGDGGMQLGDAVAMRVYKPGMLGISKDEWSSIFCAAALMIMLAGCLYAAIRSEKHEEDFCCE